MEFKINQYDTCVTDRYKEKYQIKVGAIWNDGQFHQDFKQIRTKGGETKNIPVTLTFDDDETARKFLLECLAELGNPAQQHIPQDGIPF